MNERSFGTWYPYQLIQMCYNKNDPLRGCAWCEQVPPHLPNLRLICIPSLCADACDWLLNGRITGIFVGSCWLPPFFTIPTHWCNPFKLRHYPSHTHAVFSSPLRLWSVFPSHFVSFDRFFRRTDRRRWFFRDKREGQNDELFRIINTLFRSLWKFIWRGLMLGRK